MSHDRPVFVQHGHLILKTAAKDHRLMSSLFSRNNLRTATTRNRSWWLQIIVACLAYIAANIIDYHLTIYGITNTVYREANPIVRGYMDLFGLQRGLLFYKAPMIGMIILAVIIVDTIYRKKKARFKPVYILYAGALLTALGGSLWLVKL